MSEYKISNLKIESDGTYMGTRVLVDGERIKGVRSLTLRFNHFDHLVEADLEVIGPEVALEGRALVNIEEEKVEDGTFGPTAQEVADKRRPIKDNPQA